MDLNGGGGFSMKNWIHYDYTMKGNLGLQLMSSVAERDTKPFLSNASFLHRDCNYPEPDQWIGHRDNKLLHMLPMSPNYNLLSNPVGAHTLEMRQPTKEEKASVVDEPENSRKDIPLKKRSQGPRLGKPSKPKKPKKVSAQMDETADSPVSRGRTSKKSTDLVINGIDWDISGIPTPVCSCTGAPLQCYRWGVGGWQSACCTTSISMHPLPMNTKRRGARIAGRKMSQGAFKKVLEKLAGEGYNLSNPIDLRMYWAKHGTNKFVTIR